MLNLEIKKKKFLALRAALGMELVG